MSPRRPPRAPRCSIPRTRPAGARRSSPCRGRAAPSCTPSVSILTPALRYAARAMKAVRAHDRSVEVVDVPRPDGDGVRVKIRAAGICGSDLHLVDTGFSLGHTLGHEMAGITPDGTAVAIEPILPCGKCANCTRGTYNLCDLVPGILIGVSHDGGMAEEIVVPERSLVPLHPAVPVENASLVEPLAVVVHGLRRAGLHGGERVAVIGGGSI